LLYLQQLRERERASERARERNTHTALLASTAVSQQLLVGRGREEGRERVARVRALIMRRLQEIVDGQTLCATSMPNEVLKKKVDETLFAKEKKVDETCVCKEHPKRSETHVLTNSKP
jgi:hypothetical protein